MATKQLSKAQVEQRRAAGRARSARKAEAARLNAATTSPRKARAARRNGKLGGRPPEQ